MRAVTCLIETLHNVPCDVWASVDALTQVSSRILDNGESSFYLQLDSKTGEQIGSAAGTVVERECTGQMLGLNS